MAFKTISAQLAAKLDQELMGPEIGFTLQQLMELAGLSVAQAVQKQYPISIYQKRQILVVAGPGNNGGDGLVCARHLALFGYQPVVYYPKRSSKIEFYSQLVRQLDFFGVPVLGSDDKWTHYLTSPETVCIVDAIFGFSFKPPMREPFGSIVSELVKVQNAVPIVSVDIPTGWDVDGGPVAGTDSLAPSVLVSLTVPKPCANKLQAGRTTHFVGGRFVSASFAKKFGFEPFPYPFTDQVLKL
ncbi:LAMI_0F14114g1_1 [Lachancea mirantina]|uniref:NAD(P)H-hydrate epimerase n=1 Tax=Lachancea mirantina TaxID=1230905 RepID=A0A1G4K3P1_9SACH|nr:LAMI_0F14114g1_1 [Lachancea mirantina]